MKDRTNNKKESWYHNDEAQVERLFFTNLLVMSFLPCLKASLTGPHASCFDQPFVVFQMNVIHQ